MTETTAVVKTAHATKYMTQLCKHWSHRFETSLEGKTGTANLPGGQVRFHAADDALTITVELTDDAAKTRMQGVIAEHLERFAFRELPLAYNWT